MAGLLFDKERLVKQQRSAYITISTYGINPSMSDHEREQLDYDMTSFAKAFDQNLTLLRTLISSSPKASVDCKKHYDLIVLYLYTRLQALMEQVREMRLDRSKRLKLRAPTTFKIQHPALPVDGLKAALQDHDQMEKLKQNRSDNLQFSSEQMLMLEHENAALFAELDSDLNAVREAEAKLSEIAELFSLFSTKIVEQQQQIETIYDNIVTGKSNMDLALDQLRKYLKSSVSFRFNILAIFVIAGLSLLFLDWFQD